jgi:serine/threonine-protein kinase
MTQIRSASLGDRYRIERELGTGGMATVYLARDLKHDRDVAIKVMRSDIAQSLGAERFLREIQLAASLTHPHILPLFDSGEVDGVLYYVMPCVRGQSLRDRLVRERMLSVDDAVRIASEIAGALDYAHRHGIVHRDVKPENIMFQDGHALVADFGIGKALSAADSQSSSFTQAGMSIGTPAYMSPEQAAGEGVDGRSDLYALGCVLYEMLVGEPPFTGATAQAVIAKRFVQTPADVSGLREGVPRHVSRSVQKALARAAADRYDTGASFLKSLGEVERVAAPVVLEKSLAVMPFINQSGDADNQYFSDGLSEDLINALSAIPDLQVASRTSAFRFRGADLDIRDIGAQLNVAFVLEGSVRRSGPKLRVTARLVNVTSGFQLWSERYDREMTDVFEIQDEIVGAIVKALVPAMMGSAERATRRATDNLEAYELYLKGRHYWHQRSPTTIRVAIQCFEQAIALDASYTLAYCGLADCYGILRVYGWTRVEEIRGPAAAAATRAMALDPELAEANFSKAFYQFYFEPRWRDAGPHFAKARQLNPRSSLFQVYSGLCASLEGDRDNVRRLMNAAVQLDPLSPFIHVLAGAGFYIVGEFGEAEPMSARSLALQPDYLFANWAHGLVLCGLGRFDEGIAHLERATSLSRAPIYVSMLGFGLGRAGRSDEARRLLAELDDRASRGEYVPAMSRLNIQAGLGDPDGVRRELTACVAESTAAFSGRFVTGTFLDRYRADPEVARMLDAWYGADPATPSGVT